MAKKGASSLEKKEEKVIEKIEEKTDAKIIEMTDPTVLGTKKTTNTCVNLKTGASDLAETNQKIANQRPTLLLIPIENQLRNIEKAAKKSLGTTVIILKNVMTSTSPTILQVMVPRSYSISLIISLKPILMTRTRTGLSKL